MKKSDMQPSIILRYLSKSILLLAVLLSLQACYAAPSPSSASVTAATSWKSDKQGGYVMSLATDLSGNTWVGTEDNGLWEYSPVTAKWTQFTEKEGVGDNCAYALVCDKLGRIWIGTLRNGVTVYNNRSWRSYGSGEGPIGSRVYSMATDPIDGDVWIATNSGITRYSLASDTWTNYTVADGLSSNDVYAIAFDSRGNLYAGTLCDGLCIGSRESQYREWRVVHADKHISNDAQGDGFPSEKINDVLVSRQDVVYVGTCHGLAWSFDKGVHWRFLRGEDWSSNLTHSEVDPNRDSASVCAIEVFPGGNVTEEQSTAKHITIECGNLSKGSANGDRYFQDGSAGTTNNSISLDGVAGAAPEYIYHHGRFGPEFSYLIPNLEHGATYTVRLHFISVSDAKKSPPIFNIDINDMRKLASFDPYELCGNSLNHALVEDIVVHANDEGKIKIAFNGIKRYPGYRAGAPLLNEDYITKLGEDSLGRIWVGHRKSGTECLPADTMANINAGKTGSSDFAQVFLPNGLSGSMLTGWYGGGLSLTKSPTAQGAPTTFVKDNSRQAGEENIPLPSPRKPTTTQLNEMLREVASVPITDPSDSKPFAIPLDADWNSEGNWVGRYGRYWACLCAICAPHNYRWGAGWSDIHYNARIGLNCDKGDSLRYWVHWLYSDNPRVLELPPVYLISRVRKHLTTFAKPRRQAEVDDHGETYSRFYDGPNLYFTLRIPNGVYVLSMYNFNKDGTDGPNRWRDYTVSIRSHPNNLPLDNIDDFSQWTELARGRVCQFRGGVWKRYLVRGPNELTIQIGSDFSYDTLLTSVMLDLPDEEPAPYFMSVKSWQAQSTAKHKQIEEQYKAQLKQATAHVSLPKTQNEAAAANALCERLSDLRYSNPVWWAANKSRYYGALLTYYSSVRDSSKSRKPTKELLQKIGTCRYELALYSEWESTQMARGLKTARSIEKSLTYDGKHGEGQGYFVVTKYVNKHASKIKASRD
jgi:hypothetical protein